MSRGLRERFALLAFGAVATAFGLLFAIGSWATLWLDTGIEDHGPRATATVTGKKITHNEGTEYVLRYSFLRPDGRRVDGRHRVKRWFWNSLRPGDTLTVAFDADHPTRNFPPGYGNSSIGLAFLACAVGSVFVVIGVSVIRSAILDEDADAASNLPQPMRKSSSARR